MGVGGGRKNKRQKHSCNRTYRVDERLRDHCGHHLWWRIWESYPHKSAKPLIKCDTTNGATKTWASAGSYPGEPVFISKPGAGDDDDGVVLSLVSNPSAGNSYLLLLDAKTFQETARAELPKVVSFGLHGLFMEEKKS